MSREQTPTEAQANGARKQPEEIFNKRQKLHNVS